MTWSIIVHGGASTVRPEKREQAREGCLAAASAGKAVLEQGGRAVDAVEASIRVLEDNPVFNAGLGSALNADGEVEMDAAIMDGATLDVGAVAALRGVRNPISVARAMLSEPPVLLAGEGARKFAERVGARLLDQPGGTQERAAFAASDTVGCVALDRDGSLAAGTSTGGLDGMPSGRVGDSPLPGCGLYAENGAGAVAISGDGEIIIRLTLAAGLMQQLQQQGPQPASEQALRRVARMGGEAGLIILGPRGELGFAHLSEHFPVALASSDRPPQAWLTRSEAQL